MHEDKDPVAGALQALKNQRWAGGTQDDDLEKKLMQAFDSNTRAPRGGGRRALVAAVAVLFLGGVGFAAVGGVGLVRSWFLDITVEGPNGEVIQVQTDVTPDEDGRATFTIPTGDGGEAEVTMEVQEEEDGEQKSISVTLADRWRRNRSGNHLRHRNRYWER